MEHDFPALPEGTVTSPIGFSASATYAGLKKPGGEGVLDVGLLCSDVPCVAAGVFTTNRVRAAPVLLCQQRLAKATAQALVVNAGCANACTGPQGMANAVSMAEAAAKTLGLPPENVLVASTGVIGQPLPIERLREAIGRMTPTRDGGHDLARAIMTTDTSPKEIAVEVAIGEATATVAGIAKGSGMICPNMATMLAFLTTDAAVDAALARAALREAVDESFNMVAVDNDTSTNDMVLLLANGLAGNEPLQAGSEYAAVFQAALRQVCVHLARWIARDGEGATKLMEVTVEGALTLDQARAAARTVATSSLVKAAIHGNDPNWGRIAAAVGRSGAEMDWSKTDLYLEGLCLVRGGCPEQFSQPQVRRLLSAAEVRVKVCLNLGAESATAWGCDLSAEYVRINADYLT